jgi:hypothetical protein
LTTKSIGEEPNRLLFIFPARMWVLSTCAAHADIGTFESDFLNMYSFFRSTVVCCGKLSTRLNSSIYIMSAGCSVVNRRKNRPRCGVRMMSACRHQRLTSCALASMAPLNCVKGT